MNSSLKHPVLVCAVSAAMLLPLSAAAEDGGLASSQAFIFALLGAIPVLAPVLYFLVRFGRELGRSEEAAKHLIDRVDKIERSFTTTEDLTHAKQLSHDVRDALREYVTKEHLILRLQALESKIAADVARDTHHPHPPPKGPTP